MNSLRISCNSLFTFSKYMCKRRICQSSAVMNLSIPQPDNEPKIYSAKLEQIAATITQLNLLEVAELSDLLKKRLNLPDAPIITGPVAAAAAAPAAAADDDEEKAKPAEVSYSVKIVKFDEKQKVALIKEIKNLMEGMNLVQAKKFVESLPAVVRENLNKKDAEGLKEALIKVGAEVEIAT